MKAKLMRITSRPMRLTSLAVVLLTNVIVGPASAGPTTPGLSLEHISLTCVGYKPTFGHGNSYDGENSARIRAKRDWRIKVTGRFGAAFANLSKARSLKITCHPGRYRHLPARCNISAYPCAERTLSSATR